MISGFAPLESHSEEIALTPAAMDCLQLDASLLMPRRHMAARLRLSNSVLLPEQIDRRIVAFVIGADRQLYCTASEVIGGEIRYRKWTKLPELVDGAIVRCTALRDWNGAIRVFSVRQDGFLQFSLWMLLEQDGSFENSHWTRVTKDQDDAQPFHYCRVVCDDRRQQITVFACRSPGGEIMVSRSSNAQGNWEDWQAEIEDSRGIASMTMALGPAGELVVAASATRDGETIVWKNQDRDSRVWVPIASWDPPVNRNRRLQFGRVKLLSDGVRGYSLFGLGRDPMDEMRTHVLSCWVSFDGIVHPQSIERLPSVQAFRLASVQNRMAIVATTMEGPYLALQSSVRGRFCPWLRLKMDELAGEVMDLQQFLPSIEQPDQQISYAELTGLDTFSIARAPVMSLGPPQVPPRMIHESMQLANDDAVAEHRRVEAIATGLAAIASLQNPASPLIKSTAAAAALLTAAAESELVTHGSSLGLTSELTWPGFDLDPIDLRYGTA